MADLPNGGAGNGNRARAGSARDGGDQDSGAAPRHRVTRRVRTPDAGSPDRGPRGAGARGPVADFFVRLVREKPLGLMGAAIILLLLVCGIFADVLTRYEVDEIIVMDRLAPPSAKHLLGADGAGRDILTRLIHGARISLVVGLAATTVTIVVAASIGGAVRLSRRPLRHRGAALRRRLDGVSGAAGAAHGDVRSSAAARCRSSWCWASCTASTTRGSCAAP